MSPAPRVGLVLSGGGFPAMAYQAGVLLAIQTELGWDPRDAQVIVGTSGGSMVAALLRAGLSSDDMAAWAARVPPRSDGADARAAIERLGRAGLSVVPPQPGLDLRAARSLRGWMFSILNVGMLDYTRALRHVAEILPGWSPSTLLIPAVRATDGERIVFGRDLHPTVCEAIAASSAIPMLFRPVVIDDDRYVDGGLHSHTNADLLVGQEVDVAVIVSAAPLAVRSGGQLDAELQAIHDSGIATATFHPGGIRRRPIGRNLLGRRRTAEIVARSFFEVRNGHGEATLASLQELLAARPRSQVDSARLRRTGGDLRTIGS